jgi:hypothetical protein
VPRSGEPGLDIFAMAGKSISGWLPFTKTGAGPGSRLALPYATLTERDAALYLAFHPLVAYVQRADIKPSFAAAHRLGCRLPLPFVIPYEFDGRPHKYFIDWVGLTTGGTLFGVEASIEEFKRDAQSQTKMAAAERFFRAADGWFGLFLPAEAVSDLRIANLRRLNAHRPPFAGYDEVAPEVEALLLGLEPVSIREIAARLRDRHGERVVREATWRRIAIAAADGRLVADLDTILLDLDTPLALLAPGLPKILPPELPTSLSERTVPQVRVEPAMSSVLPGPTVDPASLPARRRETFKRNLRAVVAVLNGADPKVVAREVGVSQRQVRRLVEVAKGGGEEALVPYRRIGVDLGEMDPVFIDAIRNLLQRRQSLTYRQITEAPELQTAALKAHKTTGTLPDMPSYWQVYRTSQKILAADRSAREIRSGVRHPPHSATSVIGYVRSIPSPALVVQVDEHWLDLFVVTDEGAKLTERVHAAVLICARTAAILAAVVSPRALTEEDYMRLLKQAMEPKDEIVRRFNCINPWPCYGRPAEILSDRGKFVISEHGTTVLVDRFGINQSIAPPFSPSVKGVVEALFRWITERFSHRLEGTTKSSPADRGTYDAQEAALAKGITFTELEALFFRAIVDGYMQDWDSLRGGPRYLLWERDVERFGVPQWLGSADELKLLLMRAHNPKHPKGLYLVQGGGLSFKGNWYVGEEGLTRRLRDQHVRIFWDRRDIGTIYLVGEDGVLLGAAHCPAYFSRRVSVWEQEAERKAAKADEAAARAIASGNLTTIVADAQTKKRERMRIAKAASRARFLDGQQDEIHTETAVAERRRMAEAADRGPAWLTNPSLLPGPDDDLAERVVVPFVRRRARGDSR